MFYNTATGDAGHIVACAYGGQVPELVEDRRERAERVEVA
jgi:hypothetical protein